MIRHLFQIILISALILSGGCSKSGQSKIDDTAARESFENGDYEVAAIEYRNILQKDPENFDAIRNLGFIFAEQGIPNEAVKFLLKARELQPGDPKLRTKIASVFIQLGGVNEAIEELKEILSDDRGNATAPIMLAEVSNTQDIVSETRHTLNQLQTWYPSSSHLITAQGILSLKEGKTTEAKSEFENALSKDAENYHAHFYLGITLTQLKDLEGADKHLKLASELAPLRSPKKLHFAQFKLQTGDTDTAKSEISEILEETPDYLQASVLLAGIEAAEKNYEEAIKLLESVLYRYPIHQEALLGIAKINLETEKYDEAISGLQTLVSINENSPEAYYLMAVANVKKGNIEDAKENLRSQISANPNNLLALSLFSDINSQSGTPGESIPVMEEALERSSNPFPVKLMLANAYANNQNIDKALSLVAELEAVAPTNPLVLYNMGRFELAKGEPSKAVESLSKAIEHGGYNRDVNMVLARAYHEEENWSACIKTLEPVLQENEENTPALFMIALSEQRLGNFGSARDYYLKLNAIDPDNVGVLNNLSILYLGNLGDLDLAERYARKALEILPDNPAIEDTFGWVMYKKGEYDEARNAIVKHVETLGSNQEFLYHLGLCHYVFGDEEKAKDALEKALEGSAKFVNVEDCRTRLKVLEINPQQATISDTEFLQDRVATSEDDTFAWFRLGQIHSQNGDSEKAETAFKEALKINSAFEPATKALSSDAG